MVDIVVQLIQLVNFFIKLIIKEFTKYCMFKDENDQMITSIDKGLDLVLKCNISAICTISLR